MTATKTRRPAAPITVKKGKPSASGEVIDTSKIPAVRVAEDAAKSKAKLDATIGKAVAKMTMDPKAAEEFEQLRDKDREEGKGSTKAKEASVHRLTTEWPSAEGRDVVIGDTVKTPASIVIDVIGRWTRKTKDGALVPMVTGRIVSLPAGATVAAGDTKKSDAKGRSKGDRQNAIAAGCTHVKK